MRVRDDSAVDRAATGGARTAVCVRTVKTPLGVLRVAASEDSVLSLELPRRRSEPALERWLRSHVPHASETDVLRQALAQLREYFAGKRRQFDLPVDPAGTDFQRRVWEAIAAIPFGETTSYGTIAVALGGASLARAVGAAVGANPIPIIIPCHRVIGADDSLTGYRGGLRMKIWLLRHEGVLLA
jgi:methylated-DNA-[protein]-cysteine S-methyltransferase